MHDVKAVTCWACIYALMMSIMSYWLPIYVVVNFVGANESGKHISLKLGAMTRIVVAPDNMKIH